MRSVGGGSFAVYAASNDTVIRRRCSAVKDPRFDNRVRSTLKDNSPRLPAGGTSVPLGPARVAGDRSRDEFLRLLNAHGIPPGNTSGRDLPPATRAGDVGPGVPPGWKPGAIVFQHATHAIELTRRFLN